MTAIFVTTLTICQENSTYRSLDRSAALSFDGNHLVYQGKKIELGPRAFFIDGQLHDSVSNQHPYVFNSVQKAVAKLRDGTEDHPMVLYLAPWVYWIDNPDDTAIRVPKEGSTPYGMEIKCEWLRFEGLTSDARNVVLASNRGQTIGARGNFTMFRFTGDGTSSVNITFGNYCNVDLVFPLKPSLNRQKRAAAIVQAQLIHCNGDKIVARNTRFISRLNLCPFVGGKRVLFDSCHFESTDDALCGTGVYLNSTLDFYSSKPFYRTTGTGAVFLNCRIRSFAGLQQYFTKAGGQVAVIDSKFTNTTNTYWGWQDVAPKESRNYQSNVLLNGNPLLVGKKDPGSTIDISQKQLLNAYRFTQKGKTYYNTYNLLRGDDDWDPMHVKPMVKQAESETKTALANLPVQLILSPATAEVETNKSRITLTAKFFRFGNYPSPGEKLQWSVPKHQRSLVALEPAADGLSCTVTPANAGDTTVLVMVSASTSSGLEGAAGIMVASAILKAPELLSKPKLFVDAKGVMHVDYKLDAAFPDRSDIRWFRFKEYSGKDAIEVAASREGKPLRDYVLHAADTGYRIMVSVSPKHIRSTSGKLVTVLSGSKITNADLRSNGLELNTDFNNISTRNQPELIPGFFTLLKPGADTINNDSPAWYYGEGQDGAANMTGLLQGRDAAMYYTPVAGQSGDMKVELTLAPFKTAGQGFSVAHLYMDLLIGFDTKTKTGYGLRFTRTTKYGDAVDCFFVKYDSGKATAISNPVSTTVFRSVCKIRMEIMNGKLSADVRTSATANRSSPLPNKIKISTAISPGSPAGFGIEYHGGSATMIKTLKANWYPELKHAKD